MTPYLFVFGRTPDLAIHELRSLFPSVTSLSASIAMGETAEDPKSMIARLGGTVKIATIEKRVSEVSAEVFADILAKEANSVGRRIDFGISYYDVAPANKNLLADVKEILTTKGLSARFIMAKHEDALSSVVVVKQGVSELIICPADGGGYTIGKTVAVQDFEEWNRRDYGRPHADPKAGMLPPKVARMVVNMALKNAQDISLLDPFCGMGTILAEALLTGAKVIGGDVSSAAIEGAEKNLQWLASAYPTVDSTNWRLFVADATHVAEHIPKESVDAIVTEPFMGSTQAGGRNSELTPARIKNVIKGLEKLYIGCFRDWREILRAGGHVVIALPEYHVKGRVYFVKKVVDTCETLGYTCLVGPIEYGRPQAVVRRKFFIFRKTL